MKRLAGVALACCALGAAVLLVLVASPRARALGYLTGYGFCFAIFCGCLFWIAISHVTRALWFVPLRRVAEIMISSWPLLPLGLVPLLFADLPSFRGEAVGGSWLYRLAFGQGRVELAVRSAIGWVVLGGLAQRFRSLSLAQDRAPSPALTRSLRRSGAIGLVLRAPVLTLASFDWLLALEVGKSSTIYGVYVFAGAAGASLGLLAVTARAARGRGALPAEIGPAHAQAIGKLLLTFTLFWAYIAFCQLLLVWIADLPREAGFYVRRSEGAFVGLTIALGITHFALPFLALLGRRQKRSLSFVAACGALLIAAHALDLSWLVMPAGAGLPDLALAAIAGLSVWGGAAVALTCIVARGKPLVAARDPDFYRSLELRAS